MNKQTLSGIVIVAAVVVIAVLLFVTRERVPPGPPDMGEVLAVIDDWVLDIEELDRRMDRLPPHTQALRNIDPDLFVNQLVDRHLLVREAERRGVERTDLYQQFLAEEPERPESHDQAMIQALMQLEIQQLPPLTDEILRQRFEEKPDDFGLLSFDRHRDTIRDLVAHERDVLRALEFMQELREEAEIQVNHQAREVLLDKSRP